MLVKVKKRSEELVSFDKNKIFNAIIKAYKEVLDEDENMIHFAMDITGKVEKLISDSNEEVISVEDIQNMVEKVLVQENQLDIVRAYILYREKRKEIRRKPWDMNELQQSIWTNKYQFNNETFDEWIERVSNGNKDVAKLIRERKFLFGGRILANRGLHKLSSKKVTYSNCYVLPSPEDSIESIFKTASQMARTFSYSGGVGINISKLRPKGAKVSNAALTTSGACSFMELYSMVTGLIGQNGRRGALMICMDVNHPDIEEFIDLKANNIDSVTKANISVRITDEFMQAALEDRMFKLEFNVEATGEKIVKVVNAKDMLYKLAKANHTIADPGMLFSDRIDNHTFAANTKEYYCPSTNPCGELPLPDYGACLLGSINVSEFVKLPFTNKAYFDYDSFSSAVRIATTGLYECLEENFELHPLEEQRQSARDFRQIGLGLMGMADAFIKLGIEYGKETSIEMIQKITRTMLNEAMRKSVEMAKIHGPFKGYRWEDVSTTKFFIDNIDEDVKELVKEYGMYSASLLTLAPTGSISTMLGVSGGVEPIFATSYTRKTESLHDGDVYYKVYTPIISEFMKHNNLSDDTNLPEFIKVSHDIHYRDRINFQAACQQYIDASISSTVNLPNETTVEEVYDAYMLAWQTGCKGLTIYRDGCSRMGILTTDEKKDEEQEENNVEILNEEVIDNNEEEFICPECGTKAMIPSGGCAVCLECGHSGCQ